MAHGVASPPALRRLRLMVPVRQRTQQTRCTGCNPPLRISAVWSRVVQSAASSDTANPWIANLVPPQSGHAARCLAPNKSVRRLSGRSSERGLPREAIAGQQNKDDPAYLTDLPSRASVEVERLGVDVVYQLAARRASAVRGDHAEHLGRDRVVLVGLRRQVKASPTAPAPERRAYEAPSPRRCASCLQGFATQSFRHSCSSNE